VAASILSLAVIPFWAFSVNTVILAVGAFFMQFAVQGAWGIVPVHLNELSPGSARGTFPGVVYQLGNLFASVNAPLQAALAMSFGGNYGAALAVVAGPVAVIIIILTALGSEARGVQFARVATP
jgi:SHS family lactate transporter-like MFS transporter